MRQEHASDGGTGARERERCALLVEAQAAHFEQKKLFPLARILRSVAAEIREPIPPSRKAS